MTYHPTTRPRAKGATKGANPAPVASFARPPSGRLIVWLGVGDLEAAWATLDETAALSSPEIGHLDPAAWTVHLLREPDWETAFTYSICARAERCEWRDSGGLELVNCPDCQETAAYRLLSTLPAADCPPLSGGRPPIVGNPLKPPRV